MAKDGKAYLSSLRDNRCIYIDGRKVVDVTTDDCFRHVVGTAAGSTISGRAGKSRTDDLPLADQRRAGSIAPGNFRAMAIWSGAAMPSKHGRSFTAA